MTNKYVTAGRNSREIRELARLARQAAIGRHVRLSGIGFGRRYVSSRRFWLLYPHLLRTPLGRGSFPQSMPHEWLHESRVLVSQA